MLFLTEKHALPIPHPPQMGNDGNYILSLSAFTRWLASIAENEYGVEIYPGFAGAQLLYSPEEDSHDPWGNKTRSVQGVVTNEVGLTRDFHMKSSFEPGMAFRSKVTLLAEGAHGSLSKMAITQYQLRKEAQPQTYGIGLKEVWRVDPEQYRPGDVAHTIGWPLDKSTYGGGWIYHMDDGLVSLGLVVGLDYKNPYLSPYREFQVRFIYPLLFIPEPPKYTAHETSSILQKFIIFSLGRTPRLWCTSSQRRRISIHTEAQFPWRGIDRVRSRFRQRGQDQRHP